MYFPCSENYFFGERICIKKTDEGVEIQHFHQAIADSVKEEAKVLNPNQEWDVFRWKSSGESNAGSAEFQDFIDTGRSLVGIDPKHLQSEENVSSVPGAVFLEEANPNRRWRGSCEKHFVCNFCEKAFSSRSQLICHIRLHTEENLFNCSYCEATFGYRCQLVIHARFHTGERQFACTL